MTWMVYFEIELLFYLKNVLKQNSYILITENKMKTLNLHTNYQLPTQRCEWTGIGMFSAISNPANLYNGKVDFISTQLGDTKG